MNFPRCKSGRTSRLPAVCFQLILLVTVAVDSFGHAATQSASQNPASENSSVSSSAGEASRTNTPSAASPSVTVIVEKIMSANARRSAELRSFEGKRWYHLEYRGLFGGKEAAMEVLATYTAPDQHHFTVVSQSGSKLLLNRVLLKLLDSEKEAFKDRKQVELSPRNYKFTLVDTEKITDGNICYVLAVKPRKDNKFLYAGKIWVDTKDFAVVRMEGEPAKSPSFWIRDTEIDSKWEKVEGFWLIAHNHSVSHIRLGGAATLTIDYGDYQVTAVDGHAKSPAPSPVLPDPSSVTPQR